MAKTKAKTTETTKSVSSFVKSIEDKQRQKDCLAIIGIMEKQTGFDARMWGPSIIGFGSYHYKYESGHEGDMPQAAFSPRKTAIVLYLSSIEKKEELLKKLGKHKASGGCVYEKKLEDVDMEILKKMVTASFKAVKKNYPS